MLESYILTTDGKEYVDVNNVREALGIVDEYVDVLGVIKNLKADLELTKRIYREHRDFVDKVCEAVDIQRPYLESGYANAVKLITGIKKERDALKEERDALKEKCDRMKKRANAAYGVSCGYSGNKAPAFLCNVISYSWNLGAIGARSLMDEPSYLVTNDSIRVELELRPSADYKGTFDPEDLIQYINKYGREKKLGVVESVDYQNAKTARAELANLYKTVLGKERLDTDLSPHDITKAIMDEHKRVRDSQRASEQCLRSVYMHVYEGTGYDISDIYAAPDKLAEGIITRYNSARTLSRLETLSEIDDHINEFCDKYTVVKPDRSETTRWRLDYIFGVLDEYRTLANNNFNKAEGFRKEKRAVEDSLAELRAKVREIYRSAVDDEWDEHLSYTSALNDINEEYKRVVHNFEERTADWYKAQQELDRYRLAVGSICNIPAEHREDISWIEDAFNHTKKDYLKWKDTADKLARLRSDICTALCLGGETYDEDILKRVRMTKDCHDALCKDYTELRKSIWEAMDRKPETLPEETARLVGEVTELARGEKLLIEFRDAVAKAIGLEYPTTNNVILNNVQYIYKDRGDAYDMVAKLNDHVTELEKAKEDLQKKFEFQSGLRQQWHARYESEHERANGVQKALDREREACRVKDISLETAKKQYEKVCGDLETAECAVNGMKSKVRSLQDEKTKVIKALGQDIWDDCLK
ncbi:MAG: hypothetical protein IKU36_02245 [Bacteroidales bacterium]|nr:hypothetical protein [Bacteroidales bacterium]